MAADWRPGGKARAELLSKGPDGGLTEILTGLGSLTFGEMAGERMKLGLMLHDPEEQQDCFSNNTHNSHYYDEIGIGELWRGRYVRTDGSVVQGASLRDYVAAIDPAAAKRLDDRIDDALAAIKKMKDAADSGHMAYSQMIAAGNAQGNQMVQDAMDALVAQTRAIENVAAAAASDGRVQQVRSQCQSSRPALTHRMATRREFLCLRRGRRLAAHGMYVAVSGGCLERAPAGNERGQQSPHADRAGAKHRAGSRSAVNSRLAV